MPVTSACMRQRSVSHYELEASLGYRVEGQLELERNFASKSIVLPSHRVSHCVSHHVSHQRRSLLFPFTYLRACVFGALVCLHLESWSSGEELSDWVPPHSGSLEHLSALPTVPG